MPSHHYPDPHEGDRKGEPKAGSTPGAPSVAADPPAHVRESEVMARVEKRDEVFGDPMQHRRHQTALIVKKTALSPGEKAAMGRPGLFKKMLWGLVVLALIGGGLWLVYGPLLAPPPVVLPAPPPSAAQLPDADLPEPEPPIHPTPPVLPPRPPAFAPLSLVFAGADGERNMRAALAVPEGVRIEKGFLVASPQAEGAPIWLKDKYPGDLDVEFQIAVDALLPASGQAAVLPENSRDFRLVFGDRLNNTVRVAYHVPSVRGNNWVEVFDEVGAQTTEYGGTRYGWPFENGVFYRLKISRRGDKWMISRDGEFMFAFFFSAAHASQIGYAAVSGARIQSIQIVPK